MANGTEAPGFGPGTPKHTPPEATRAWNRLLRTMAVDAPKMVNRSAANRRRALAVLRRRR